MADIFSSHPYPGRKNIMPSKHHCELCDKTFAYKDRAAHDRSKKHKAAMDKQQAVLDKQQAAIDKKDAFATAKAGGYKGTEAEHNAKYDADHADPNACHNCGQSGHMSKECTEPKKQTGECFNCGQVGHSKSDCPNERKVTCRNCLEEGHMSRECPHPRSAANVTCNNCDQLGHFSKYCTEPKDWSRVICKQCGKPGHTIVRCKADPSEYIDNNENAPPNASEDWMNTDGASTAEPVAVEGSWMAASTETAAVAEW